MPRRPSPSRSEPLIEVTSSGVTVTIHGASTAGSDDRAVKFGADCPGHGYRISITLGDTPRDDQNDVRAEDLRVARRLRLILAVLRKIWVRWLAVIAFLGSLILWAMRLEWVHRLFNANGGSGW